MPDKSLAERMSDAARELQQDGSTRDIMGLAVEVARREIDPCDGAALSIIRSKGRVETPAATGEEARRSDELQYELQEGPCLDAIRHHDTVSSADLRTDDRWPSWGPRMASEVGYRSMAAFQLFTDEANVGALNLYSRGVDAFRVPHFDHATALAAHIAVAIRSAQRVNQLTEALTSRTAIGTAIGIVMERYSLDNHEALAVLTRVSQETNRKVRDIAAQLVAGGPLPTVADPERSSPPG